MLNESRLSSKELELKLSSCQCGVRGLGSERKRIPDNRVDAIGTSPTDPDQAVSRVSSRTAAIAEEARAEMGSILNSPPPTSKSRSMAIAAEARMAMNNILNTPVSARTTANKRNAMMPQSIYPIGSRVSFLWSSAGQQTAIPWPGTVKNTNTLLRCAVPNSIKIGDCFDIVLKNGVTEKVVYEIGKTFQIGSNRLQIPVDSKPGKSIIWNNIKGENIGIRWYDVQLDKCDHITRIYENEIREFIDGDEVPVKDQLLGFGDGIGQGGDKQSSFLSPLVSTKCSQNLAG
jgi:hypothetical protein